MVSGPEPPVRVSTRSRVSPCRRSEAEYWRSTVAVGSQVALTSRLTRAPSPTLSPPKKASGAQSSQMTPTPRPWTARVPAKLRVVLAVTAEELIIPRAEDVASGTSDVRRGGTEGAEVASVKGASIDRAPTTVRLSPRARMKGEPFVPSGATKDEETTSRAIASGVNED